MRGNAARALVPALAVLALVGMVAVAATGSTPSGSGDTRPADALLDTIYSLMLIALVPAAAILVYGLMQRKEIARELASGQYRRTGFVGFAAFMLIFALVTYFRLRTWERPPPEEPDALPLGGRGPVTTPPPSGAGVETAYEPRFAWLPVLVVLALAATGAAATFLAARRRRTGSTDADEIAQALADVLDDTLDDLRAESDPRRAVIAAYARLERVLAAHGLPRRAPETPAEYLARILGDLDVDERAVRGLTGLFTRAKFSQHAIDAGMKEEAIDALAHVRNELRDADARRESERAEGLFAAEGRV